MLRHKITMATPSPLPLPDNNAIISLQIAAYASYISYWPFSAAAVVDLQFLDNNIEYRTSNGMQQSVGVTIAAPLSYHPHLDFEMQ